MTRKEALAELIAKVEAGGLIQPFLFQDLFNNQDAHENCAGEAYGAYKGSLDAAKALHEAALPGWWWWTCISADTAPDYEVILTRHDEFGETVSEAHGYSGNPARAWLLAILRALHSMEPSE